MDDQIGHVSDQVGGEANVEENVKGVEELLLRVLGVQVAVADGGEGGNGPVHRCHITHPQALWMEVWHGGAYPSVARIVVSHSNKKEEASSTVDDE